MSPVHICNTFFERELESSSKKSLAAWLRSHPIVLQLQFLPLIYAGPNDRILVSDLPSNPDPRLCLLDEAVQGSKIEDWGASQSIAEWAKIHEIPYPIPPWETVQRINSKIFSFTESPKLPGSKLLQTEGEVLEWIERVKGPKVLKTAFGTAGGGHFHIGKDQNLSLFLRKQKHPVIGEPWVERVFDFSTQWRDGKLLGATVFENEANGTYKSTLIGPEEKLFQSFQWALEEHLEIAKPLLEKIGLMGFRGNLGLDAYIYRWEGRERLQPIVEINGRKTMSWAALQYQQQRHPDKTIRLSYTQSKTGLLPSELMVNGKTIRFQRQVQISESLL